MFKERFVTKIFHKKTKKIHEEVSVCSVKKDYQFSIKIRGGEAQRADAAARHLGRSEPRVKKFGSTTRALSEFSQYRGFTGVFFQYRGFFGFDTTNPGVDLR